MVTINEDVHRPHESRNVCSTPNFTNETGLYPGVTSGSWWDGPMVLPCFRHHLEASLADSHHVALNLSLQGSPGWVREDPVRGGTWPRNVLFRTGQECKVSFSKVLRCVSGPNTVITDVGWVIGHVPGDGGCCSSGELQGCVSTLSPRAVVPRLLLRPRPCLPTSTWRDTGFCRGVWRAGEGWNAPWPRACTWPELECGCDPLSLQDCCGCVAPPNTCGCTKRLHWWSLPSSGGADDNLRQLTRCEVPEAAVCALAGSSNRPGHTGPFRALLPLLCVTPVSAHPLGMPAGGHLMGKDSLLGAGTLRHAPALVEALGLACQALSLRGALGKHQLRQEWVLKTSTRLK